MKDNIRLYITLGFIAVLILMFALVAVALIELQSSNDSMEKLVEITNRKTAAANEMRDAIRLRTSSLKNMQLKTDAFERDAELQRFTEHAGKYRMARERLAGLGMDEAESMLHNHLQQLTRSAQPYVDAVSDLLMNDAPPQAIEPVMKNATLLQGIMLEKLEELVALEQHNSEQVLAASRGHYNGTLQLLIVLFCLVLLLLAMVARTVIGHVSSKNRELSWQSSHDALTGLINRQEFELRVDRIIRVAQSQAGTHALLYMDLDQFKLVNDTCGHAAGDELLQQLSQLMLSTVRHRDTLSRLGGDEFGMLLENCPLDKAITIANGLLKVMDSFVFTWQDSTFTLGMSIGVVQIDRSVGDIGTAMRAADSACYIAKESGRNRVQVAHTGNRKLRQRQSEMQWVSRLTRAMDSNQFELFYQPIVPCARKSDDARHIEIMLRMIDDDGTVIAPGVFMPAAEKYNLAVNIDRWVIGNAMEWLAQHSGSDSWPLTAMIGISGQSVGNPATLNFIVNKLEETGLEAHKIIFEITEVAASAHITTATSFMLTLRGCGFRFALNDCGSGLSSFTYLKKLPVDFLKIDGAFVRDILADPVDYAVVRSITELGQLLGKETMAESVENLQVAEELRAIGIDYVQGYAYARPLPLHSFAHTTRPRLVIISN